MNLVGHPRLPPSDDTVQGHSRLLSNDHVHVIWHHDPSKKIVVLAIPKQERFLDDMGRSRVAETRGAAASRQVLFEVNEHPGLRVVEFVGSLLVVEQPSVGLEELRRSAVVLAKREQLHIPGIVDVWQVAAGVSSAMRACVVRFSLHTPRTPSEPKRPGLAENPGRGSGRRMGRAAPCATTPASCRAYEPRARREIGFAHPHE